MSQSELLIEQKQCEKETFVLVPHYRFENNYVLSLWKEIDELIGWGNRNIYMIRNSQDLEAGKGYRFTWIRDDFCVCPWDNVCA